MGLIFVRTTDVNLNQSDATNYAGEVLILVLVDSGSHE